MTSIVILKMITTVNFLYRGSTLAKMGGGMREGMGVGVQVANEGAGVQMFLSCVAQPLNTTSICLL